MNNAVNLGIGNNATSGATGMFYTADANTAIPTDVSDLATTATWTEVGFISQDGITLNTGLSDEALKDWSQTIRRVLPSQDNASIAAPIISTTAQVFKTLFGASAVTSDTDALVSVHVDKGARSDKKCFVFVMKDGDNAIIIGGDGVITSVSDVNFAPTEAITWNATIELDSWTLNKTYTAPTGG
jgi:hypothetical protein